MSTRQLSDNNADMEETVKANLGFDILIIGCVACVNELDTSSFGGGEGH